MKQDFLLNNGEISALLQAADREAERAGVESEDRLRFRLSLEELLLSAAEAFGSETKASVSCKSKKGYLTADLSIPGPEKDLVKGSPSPVLPKLLSGWENAPSWNYESGSNHIVYRLPYPGGMRENLRFTWKFTKAYRGPLFIAVASQIVTVIMKVVVPVVSAKVIVAYVEGAIAQVISAALMLMVVNMITDAFAVASNRFYNVVYNKTLTDLESDLVDSVLRISNGCLDEKGAGLFIQRLTTDTARLALGFSTLADMSSQMCTYIGIMGAILITSPPVFLVVLVIFGIQVAIEQIRTHFINIDDRIYRNANERFTGFVGEMVRGSKDVKLMHNEDVFEEELNRRINEANDTRMYRDARSWKYKFFRWEIGNIGGFGFAVLLAFLLSKNMIAPAITVVLFNYYTNIDATAILLIGDLFDFIRDFNLSNERVRAIMQSNEFTKEVFGDMHLEELKGDITFDGVWFSYDHDHKHKQNWVFKDMNFHIPAGQTAAFVGQSGCGKSTVFNLINKLFSAQRGRILLDGIDIEKLDRDSIRDNIAVVSQDPYLFNMSIRDNLRLAKPDITEDEMISVCKLACIHDDIEQMTDGYDSVVGEGGVSLSGGQKQRIAIARALLKNCSVLLFDEATSALDNITQENIQQAIHNIRDNCTVLIIAHRLSTVIDADNILYIQDGKILDSGTHDELISRCEPYRSLAELEGSR